MNITLGKEFERRITEKVSDGFDCFDRLFPNQDLMLEGGFGNLIALPLQ